MYIFTIVEAYWIELGKKFKHHEKIESRKLKKVPETYIVYLKLKPKVNSELRND